MLSALGSGDKQRLTLSRKGQKEGGQEKRGRVGDSAQWGVRVQKPEEEEDASSRSSKLGGPGSGRGMCKAGGEGYQSIRGQEPESCRGWAEDGAGSPAGRL